MPIENNSTEPISITSLRSSCGCVSAAIERRLLRPGEGASCHLDVAVDSEVPRTIFVLISHNQGRDLLRVRFSGHHHCEIGLSPSAIVNRDMMPGATATQDVIVSLPSDGRLLDSLGLDIHPRGAVVASIEPLAGSRSQERARLRIHSRPIQQGEHLRGGVLILAGTPARMYAKLPFEFKARADVAIVPRELVLRFDDSTQIPKLVATLEFELPLGFSVNSIGGPAWIESDLKSDEEQGKIDLRAVSRPPNAPRVEYVVVRFSNGSGRAGSVRVPLAVETQ